MTYPEALKLGAALNVCWPQQAIAPITVRAWWEAQLSAIDLSNALEGVRQLTGSSRFMPALAEIVEAAGRSVRNERELQVKIAELPGVPPSPELSAAVHAMFHGNKRPLTAALASLARDTFLLEEIPARRW